MLESILDRFSKSKPEVVVPKVEQPKPVPAKPASQATPTECPVCHGKRHWQPRGQTAWFCFQCDPPPALSMIGTESVCLESLIGARTTQAKSFALVAVIVSLKRHGAMAYELLIVLLAQNLLTHRLSNKVPA